MPLTCSSTPVCLGAVLSAHSCPRSLLPRETERSLNFASACRSSCEALSSSFPSSSPSVLFAILLPHRRIYPIASDVSPPPFIPRRHVYPVFAALFHRYPPLLRAAHRFVSLLPSSRVQTSFPFLLLSYRVLFLFQLPIHIADLSFSISSFSYFASPRYCCFELSSISRRLFNLLPFISSKDRADPPTYDDFYFSSFPSIVRHTLLSFYVPHLDILCM